MKNAQLEWSYWPAEDSDEIHPTTIGSILRDAATAAPNRTAMVNWASHPSLRRTWTFAQLLRDAERTARALLLHFRPGSHIAIQAPNIPEWVLLELGAGLAGMVIVTISPSGRARELEYVLRQSQAVGLFHVAGFRCNPIQQWVTEVTPLLPNLQTSFAIEAWDEFLSKGSEEPLPEVDPYAPAQIQYTSGTTGEPKGALLHHAGLTNNARMAMKRLGVGAGDVYAHGMPFFHTAGCVLSVLGPIQAGATQVFPQAFDSELLLGLIERERATHFLGVPTMFVCMIEHLRQRKYDFSSLKAVCCGGASIVPELARDIESIFSVKLNCLYGQTESSPVITQSGTDDLEEDRINAATRPLPQTAVKIVDPLSGAVVRTGQIGEVCTRGYLVMHEYFDKIEASALAIDAERWLHTGDLGAMDERGYIRITGRLKDMVIRGGENLFPAEIEAVLAEYPGIVEVAVVGVADAKMGEELVAFVRIHGEPPSVEALKAYVCKRLAKYKTPRYWRFVAEFPLTESGKIKKAVLREQWTQGTFAENKAGSLGAAS
ncbi:AMP-binding protein [Nevskia soli]|uniref:AMP-binding protein n=1 Tax=Nevskia soli TaxID=418856 RepID=UPI00068D6794|nr:AMP-binding protein [Nevskia soli]